MIDDLAFARPRGEFFFSDARAFSALAAGVKLEIWSFEKMVFGWEKWRGLLEAGRN